jgi:peptidoglycan/LPS O-acetylase OafA/YrhL
LYFHVIPLASHGSPGNLPLRLRPGEAWYWVYLSNWRVDAFRDLRHFWSLAIEEQFYMIWPLVVMLTPRTKLKYIAGSCVLLSPLLRVWFAYRGIPAIYLYQTTPFRLEGLALGASLAIAAQDELTSGKLNYLARCVWPFAAAAFLFIAVAYGTSPLTRPMSVGGFLCVDLLSAAMVLRALGVSGTDSGLARKLRAPWLMNFGKYSYGLYVWHFPIARRARLIMAGVVSHSQGWLHAAILPASLVIGIGVSYAVALASWNFIERPCARLRDRLLARDTHGSTRPGC